MKHKLFFIRSWAEVDIALLWQPQSLIKSISILKQD